MPLPRHLGMDATLLETGNTNADSLLCHQDRGSFLYSSRVPGAVVYVFLALHSSLQSDLCFGSHHRFQMSCDAAGGVHVLPWRSETYTQRRYSSLFPRHTRSDISVLAIFTHRL
jgi:hypothetical protein